MRRTAATTDEIMTSAAKPSRVIQANGTRGRRVDGVPAKRIPSDATFHGSPPASQACVAAR